jgi:hypothetical protein
VQRGSGAALAARSALLALSAADDAGADTAIEPLLGAAGRERADVAARRALVAAARAEEGFADACAAGEAGVPPPADALVTARSRALRAALDFLTTALSHDAAFLRGARAVALPDPLTSLPELLRAAGALPLIARAAGYAHDATLAHAAACLLRRLALERTSDLSPRVLAAEIAGSSADTGGRGFLLAARASGDTQVISANTSPGPPSARAPRWTRWKSFGIPSFAE